MSKSFTHFTFKYLLSVSVLYNMFYSLRYPPTHTEWKAMSEPDNDELLKSREKVALWLKRQHTNPSTSAMSGYETASGMSWGEEEQETEAL